MKSAGVSPNVVTYTSLLNAYVKSENADGARAVLDEMKAEGIEPNMVTYNNLLDVYSRTADVVAAWDVLHEMREAGCQPNLVTYTSLVGVYAKIGNIEGAKEVLADAMQTENKSLSSEDRMCLHNKYKSMIAETTASKRAVETDTLSQEVEIGTSPPSFRTRLQTWFPHVKPQQMVYLASTLLCTVLILMPSTTVASTMDS